MLNVGAGTGSYEPSDLEVTAVEPSATMIAQRPNGSAPAVRAAAEELPFPDHSFDVVTAVLSDHHWRDRPAAMRELKRVARRRVVLVNADPGARDAFWLTRDYLPGFSGLIPEPLRQAGAWRAELERLLGAIDVRVLPVRHDCRDGFYGAYWRRPAAYLDPAVRDAISVFHRLSREEVCDAVARLESDLRDRRWLQRNANLLELEAADVGMRIVVAPAGN